MGKLALTGGTPLVDSPLGVTWPVYDERDERALQGVLQSRSWTRSKFHGEESWVWRFEEAFAAFQDARHGVAVATGSIGMELALKAVGVEPGDEVIIPAATWITVATAVVAVGAAPVFVDIDPGTYNIDPGKIADAITPKTRAVMCVHNGGMPADMDALRALVDKHGIALVGDCAHAHGSQWRGRGVGAIEDAGAFSFQGSKVVALGEGGMVLTDRDDLQERLFGLHHVNGGERTTDAGAIAARHQPAHDGVDRRPRHRGHGAVTGANCHPRGKRALSDTGIDRNTGCG